MRFNILAITGLTLAQLMSASEPAPAWSYEKEATTLLKEIRSISGKLKVDAETLESFNLSQLHWQTHGTQLNLVRDHINSIGERLERLQSIKHVTEPWQQSVIDRIVSVGVELRDRTTSAILHLNENQNHLFAESYKDHLTAISDQSEELFDTVRTYLDLAETREKLRQLQERVLQIES